PAGELVTGDGDGRDRGNHNDDHDRKCHVVHTEGVPEADSVQTAFRAHTARCADEGPVCGVGCVPGGQAAAHGWLEGSTGPSRVASGPATRTVPTAPQPGPAEPAAGIAARL